MMLKNDDISSIEKKIEETQNEIQAMVKEHDRNRLDVSNSELESWFNSLPIESLKESLDRDRNKPRRSYSLKNMLQKFRIRKQCMKKNDEAARLASKLVVAKSDFILEQIRKIEDDYKETI
jgi:hypothetical protein